MRGRKRLKQESLFQFFFRASSCPGGEGQTKAVYYKTRNKNKRSRLDLTNSVPYIWHMPYAIYAIYMAHICHMPYMPYAIYVPYIWHTVGEIQAAPFVFVSRFIIHCFCLTLSAAATACAKKKLKKALLFQALSPTHYSKTPTVSAF